MSKTFFKIKTHYVDSSHIRQYPRALAGEQNDVLKLAVKQYTPLDNPDPKPGDVTVLAAHANGVGKELYEPLWDDLLQKAHQSGAFRIRNIWIADVAWQGESGVLNEHKLGDEPSWFDHARDLLHFVNMFRKELPQPVVGIGHSMGGNNVVNLALMHPRLLAGLILIDPVIQKASSREGNFLPAQLSTFRRDVWPSREEAEAAFRRNKFYQTWDPRVFANWIKYGLRELPTAVYSKYDPRAKSADPSSKTSASATPSVSVESTDSPLSRPVTLTTTKYQEVYSFMRGNHPDQKSSLDDYKPDKRTHPDLTGEKLERPFYRPEPIITFNNLPHLRPPVMYIFAPDQSALSRPRMIRERLEMTGTGIGGSGGVENGAVKAVSIPAAGHFVPFEKPGTVAGHMQVWLSKRLKDWRDEAEVDRQHWASVPAKQKQTFTDDRMFWTGYMKASRDQQPENLKTQATNPGNAKL